MTIDVRQAVKQAKNHLNQIIDLFGNVSDIRLEEIELSSDNKSWLITLGFLFDTPMNQQKNLPDILNKAMNIREYKIVEIDAETGELKSIKIREL
ncbi:hypothetical protein [Crocosphaera sp.]|uniref:hypothetical protein n=1 Tax=Crocosphaera sp. TaxID=2729996 RepID=UPI003F265024|nr:hypothetical protein [Crocosphaera sp.]